MQISSLLQLFTSFLSIALILISLSHTVFIMLFQLYLRHVYVLTVLYLAQSRLSRSYSSAFFITVLFAFVVFFSVSSFSFVAPYLSSALGLVNPVTSSCLLPLPPVLSVSVSFYLPFQV